MRPFDYSRATSPRQALEAASKPETSFLAGGTELLNWMRLGIIAPAALVDIGRVEGLERIERIAGGGLRLGALARLSDIGEHEAMVRDYPVLSQAILKAASPQIRNLATIGGNLLQRTRCPYFRAEETLPCNKRVAGSGCAARHGSNERHALFGWTDACVATQPSDPAVALAALDAVVITERPKGGRRIPIGEFHVLPGQAPEKHHVLEPGELIVAVELAAPAPHSAYIKVRERESYEYALVSAAAALTLENGIIRSARVALGSVAMKPWRLVEAERALVGTRPDSKEAQAALALGFTEARALEHNGFKIPLARNAAARAVRDAARGAS
ncbi:FAD binding domain-containing protein [Cystobacter ferrugineus]|uniref:FAD-binding molybdopterin dehydrogenase n=1 Tax=Cystobacter ferrugineus TaxID=83449 RepID=A0A1L9BHK1_9BACT|nr:FAD binding domain-containing protein [Cystobacter ferrugineus]OJH41695.1 FAD-binding molybdopterin dehydrogenase [Cystobacter ferrugineus]